MSNFNERIKQILLRAHENKDVMSDEEKAVTNVLVRHYGKAPISQSYIAKTEDWMGCHEKHETPRRPNQTTLRKVRQIIRDLRVKYQIPILSGRGGYWIPRNETEAKDFLKKTEAEAVAHYISRRKMYMAMADVLGEKSEFFQQDNLL